MTFLLPVPDVARVRRGPIDLYGVGDEPRPAVVLVHGGPVAPDADPEPREWFAPYAALLAWNYPVLAPGPDWDGDGDVPRFDCVGAVGAAPTLPKVLLRVEHEIDFCVPGQDAFVAAAATLTVVDVPGAHHPFEDRDHTDDTRAAVVTALDLVASALGPASAP